MKSKNQTNKQGFLIFTISKFNKEETNTVLQKLPEKILLTEYFPEEPLGSFPHFTANVNALA